MNTVIIGIDPGNSGSICIMKNGKILRLVKMPETPKGILDVLKPWGKLEDTVCYLEKVHSMPAQGVTSVFTFGKNYGMLVMAVIASEIKLIDVTPQKWQKSFSLGTKGEQTTSQWKNKLKDQAERLYPKQIIFLWGADAVLIAHYGAFQESISHVTIR